MLEKVLIYHIKLNLLLKKSANHPALNLKKSALLKKGIKTFIHKINHIMENIEVTRPAFLSTLKNI